MFLDWCPCVDKNWDSDSKASTKLKQSEHTLELIGKNFIEKSEEKFIKDLIKIVSSYEGTIDSGLAKRVEIGMSSNKGDSPIIIELRTTLGKVVNRKLSPTIDEIRPNL